MVAVAAAVFVGSEEELRHQHRRARQVAQPLEVVRRDPAVGHVDVVVGRQHVDEAALREHGVLVVVQRQAVAHHERARVGVAQRVVHEPVVARGDQPREGGDRVNALAAGAQLQRRAARLEPLERVQPRRHRHEVGEQPLPAAVVAVVQQLPQHLLRRELPVELEVPQEQRRAPPADLVVGEVADHARVAALRGDDLARDGARGLGLLRIEDVVPVQLGPPAEVDLGHPRQAHHRRLVGPPAGRVEAPRAQAPLGGLAPRGERGVVAAPEIGAAGARLVVIVATVDGVDAQREEAPPVGLHEPVHAVVLRRRPAAGSGDRRRQQGRQREHGRGGHRAQCAHGARRAVGPSRRGGAGLFGGPGVEGGDGGDGHEQADGRRRARLSRHHRRAAVAVGRVRRRAPALSRWTAPRRARSRRCACTRRRCGAVRPG